ncbi:MAG: hypothetical protein K2J71_09955 [Oscillospiraceae bacterium]|nr:hypothetical protein [Oscillospiraceae bacterium]
MTDFKLKFSKLAETLKTALPVLKLMASIGLLAFAVILIGYYTLFASRGSFHADTTDTIMWAQASYDAGKIFNPDFAYACLLPFGTSLIMTFLIPFTGVTMTTHVLGMCIFFLLFTGSMIWMLRQMDWQAGWIAATVFSVLMLCSGSTKLREIFWGHTIYYSLGVLFLFVGLGLLFHRINQENSFKNSGTSRKALILTILDTVLIFIWFILTCMDQTIAVTIFAVPVILAVFCERFLDRKIKLCSFRNLDTILLIILMSTGMCIGYGLTNKLAGDITAGYQEAYSAYSDMDTWMDNLLKFPTAWVSLLGATAVDGDPLLSVESVQSLLTIVTGIILFILPTAALLCYPKIQDRKCRILILAYWFMTGLILLGYVVGKLSVANWRLSPIVAMSALVSIVFLKWAVTQINLKRLAILLSIPVYVVACFNATVIAGMPIDNTSENYLYQIAGKLEELHLSYGYATFWNANSLTIITDSRIRCRDVEINENGFYQRYYQTNSNWYEDQPGQEEYFILLSDLEASWVINGNPEIYQRPHRTEDVTIEVAQKQVHYQVWIYPENIF